MSIFAIGDLHLSHNFEKPMDIFGDGWANHTEKISENWNRVVRAEDLSLSPAIYPGQCTFLMRFLTYGGSPLCLELNS
jgi:predicted phosphohydrolase